MLRYVTDRGGVTMVGIGLSAENIKRLQEDQPITVKLDEPLAAGGLGLETKLMLFIFAGEDEDAMRRDLEQAGMIGPTSKLVGMIGPTSKLVGPDGVG